MDNDAHSLEFLEISIDRRKMDVGCLDLDRFGQLLGGPVARVVEEGMEEQSARTGDAPALLFELGQDVVHGLESTQRPWQGGFSHLSMLTLIRGYNDYELVARSSHLPLRSPTVPPVPEWRT